MDYTTLKPFLDEKAELYNKADFIESDPISIPHKFTKKEDIEISGFLAATIAWGQRKTIINNANKMVEMMDFEPHNFILNHEESDLKNLPDFKHRTFNKVDFCHFMSALKHIYKEHGGLEKVFSSHPTLKESIHHFKQVFFSIDHPARTQKHVSDPLKGSSSKRICMYLRWMVRQDNKGVDFGIWKSIDPGILMCPLDIHTGNVGRKIGLLNRKQNDWKAVEELSNHLRIMNPKDPVVYDFALFGLGVFENF